MDRALSRRVHTTAQSDGAAGERGLSGVRRNTQLRNALLLAGLAPLGYWFCSIPFQFLVAELSGNDPSASSLLYLFLLIPALFASPLAGVGADRWSRRSVLLSAHIGTAVTASILAIGVHEHVLGLAALIGLAGVIGTTHAVVMSTGYAYVADHTTPGTTGTAVLIQSTAMNLARTAGPLAAAGVVFAAGPGLGFSGYAIVASICATILARSRSARPTPVPRRVGMLRELRLGVAHVRQRRPAAALLLIVAVNSLLTSSFMVQYPALAARFSEDGRAFVLLTLAAGTGALAGVGLLRFTPGYGQTDRMWVATWRTSALLALTVCGIGLAPTFLSLMGIVATASALQFAALTLTMSCLHRLSSPEMRGRVMGLYSVCYAGLIPIGGMLLAAEWKMVGPAVAFVTDGAAALILLLLLAHRSRQRETAASCRAVNALTA